MEDNNGKYIFFSSIGKKLNNAYGLRKYFIEKTEKKSFKKNDFLKRIEKNFDEKEEDNDSLLNKDIFDISYNNVKSKNNSERHNINNINGSLSLSEENNEYNHKYKYHINHLKKLKMLNKEEQNKNNKIGQAIMYEPNIDTIKKRIIIGPCWKYMTGRKEKPKIDKYNLILNSNTKANNTTFCHHLLNSYIKEKNIKKNKVVQRYNNPILSARTNTTNIIKKETSKNSFIDNKTKKSNNISSENIDKRKIKKDKIMLNLDFSLLLSKIYRIDNEKKTNDKFIKRYILPFSKSINNKKKFHKIYKIQKVKKYKNNFSGLNSEEINIINDYIKNKKLESLRKEEKMKRMLIKKKDKKISINLSKHVNLKSYINNSYEGNYNKKSFNSYINQALLNYQNNNMNIKSYMTKNKSFHNLFKKNKEFYYFDYDQINKYNYQKFDNITYKTINNNK